LKIYCIMKFDYARVSTRDETSALPLDPLKRAECKRIFEEPASDARADHPQAKALLKQLRMGDS
jgi:DNA invertase Pin-like site-specific DNA recombinase